VGRGRRAASGAVPGARLIFRRARFGELIARQLDLFEREHAHELERAAELLTAYDAADRDEAEERYGDYADAVDEVVDLLEEMRDAYAAALGEAEAERYEDEFARAARRRFPRFPLG
jgi:hypothetical protein